MSGSVILRPALAALALAAALGLAGCGQKGPLTPPDDASNTRHHGAPEAAPQDNENG